MMRLHERLGFTGSIITVTSNTTNWSRPINCQGADSITFLLGMGTAIGGINSTITIRQAANVTACESTNGALVTGATAVLGSTAANRVVNAVEAIISVTTATTAETVSINGVSLTYSTLGGGATLTTGFGSTIGATVAGGLEAIMNSLSSKINNSTFAAHAGITASTPSTLAVVLTVDDTASTDVNCTSTAASPITCAYVSQQAQISISVDMLNATAAYVCAEFSTAATSVLMGVATIKDRVYWNPPPPHGVVTVAVAT